MSLNKDLLTSSSAIEFFSLTCRCIYAVVYVDFPSLQPRGMKRKSAAHAIQPSTSRERQKHVRFYRSSRPIIGEDRIGLGEGQAKQLPHTVTCLIISPVATEMCVRVCESANFFRHVNAMQTC
jgi:hypothetical protein